jgi:hypothetical protein
MANLSTKVGWTLSVAGFLLLMAMGNLGMVTVLIPLAAVLAAGVVMFPWA